ncbi:MULTISPECIES: alginate export family protein [Enterobacterales]|uniref:alginate export family protein n=1 Tax=Enterobacterales TaxID=91347 RepID=UPI002ED8DD61
MGLLLTPLLSFTNEAAELNDPKSTKQTSNVKIIDIEIRAKVELFNLRNENLREGNNKKNELELEPLLRLNAWVMKDSPLYGRTELEWKRLTTRKSGEQSEKQTKLELNQAYIGMTNEIIPYTHLKLGRWLYRDEREWLFDENLDGVYVQSQMRDWFIDAAAGRINYWQKDLMDSTTRNTETENIGSIMLRRTLEDKWQIGTYAVAQHNTDNNDRQLNVGLRSHNPARKGLQHWLELGMSKDRESGNGYAVDIGGTYLFDHGDIKPRVTLGYAFGSKDYRQTGLHDNQATFGGATKFKIYGETLDPDLTNIHIVSTGLGINVTRNATLDVIYHAYSQASSGDISGNNVALKSQYDRQNTRYLGSGVDVVFGWEPTDNTKVEAIAGMFAPSKRFVSADKTNSPRSDNAYSVGMEFEMTF